MAEVVMPQMGESIVEGTITKWLKGPGDKVERDEVLLIKGWDSLDDGRTRFTPHGAFQLEDQDPDTPPRESIEVRTYLVFEG